MANFDVQSFFGGAGALPVGFVVPVFFVTGVTLTAGLAADGATVDCALAGAEGGGSGWAVLEGIADGAGGAAGGVIFASGRALVEGAGAVSCAPGERVNNATTTAARAAPAATMINAHTGTTGGADGLRAARRGVA